MKTLQEAREQLIRDRIKGAPCPCCDQFAKQYTRKLSKGTAITLKWLADEFRAQGTQDYIAVREKAPRAVLRSYEPGLLRHFGLVEQAESTNGSKGSGLWRPTPRGLAFVQGDITIPQHVVIYNDKAIGFAGGETTLADALPFNYRELMAL